MTIKVAQFPGSAYVAVMAEPFLIGYARVSTEDQDLSLQRQALERYGVPPENIYEEHASGGKIDRKQLGYALKACRGGDTFVVWRLDRLGRTLPHILDILERLRVEGVRFVSLSESWDTSTPGGKAMMAMSAIFAELERDLISERTKAGIAAARARGVEFGQPHSIKDNPKRLAAIRPFVEDGRADLLTPAEALDILNRADPKARRIKSAETWRRWRREGYEGVD